MNENARRWLVAIVAIGLAVARVVWPSLNIDLITLGLIAIAAAALLLPSVSTMVPYVSRVKAAGVEVEFREEVKALGVKVDAAVNAVADLPEPEPSDDPNVQLALDQAASDPRAALLLVSAQLESIVRQRLREADLKPRFGLAPAVEQGVKAGVFDPTVMPAVRDFATLRNQIAHGEAFDVSNETVLALVGVGVDPLRLLQVRPDLAVSAPPSPS